MWDDLILPLSSRCSQRYPTRFKNTPCDELKDQQEGTLDYPASVYNGNFPPVFIYVSFSLEAKETQGWEFNAFTVNLFLLSFLGKLLPVQTVTGSRIKEMKEPMWEFFIHPLNTTEKYICKNRGCLNCVPHSKFSKSGIHGVKSPT